MLTFEEYQEAAHKTSGDVAVGGCTWVYPALGLANEAGEVLGKMKKIIRDRNNVVEAADRVAIGAELGDVLWYLAELATQLNIPLSGIAAQNLSKLRDRQARGVIQGSGDNR